MPLFNRFVMNVDLKRQLTAKDRSGGQITIAQGESALLLFKVYDNGIPYDYTSATKVKIFMKTCSGKTIETEAKIINFENGKAISYEFEKIASVEVGFTQLALTIYENDYVVHVQPFAIYIYDNLQGGSGSYLELIKSLMDIIDKMQGELIKAIPLSEKGVANGVATLDENGKIPLIQLPDEINAIIEHLTHTVFKDKVHGMQIDDDGILQYFNGSYWQNVGFAPEANGNGGGNNVLKATVTVVNGIASVLYTGLPTVTAQKYAEGDRNLSYFTLNGTAFTDNSFPVNKEGLHTLWYRDSNGNTYVVLFNVKKENLPKPIVTIIVENGLVVYNIDRPTTLVKYEIGEKEISYFQNSGIVLTTNSFPVNTTGKYTLYYKLENGSEYVEIINVSSGQIVQPILLINADKGIATIKYSPVSLTVSKIKYSNGNRDIMYFTDGNGTTITDLSFPVIVADYYTAYVEFTNGQSTVGVIKVEESQLASNDVTPPEVTISASQYGSSVIIRSVATDNESKLVRVSYSDGSSETLNNLSTVTRELNVTSNGTYSFTYTNGAGLSTTRTITIDTLNDTIPDFTYGFTINMNNSNPSTSVQYTNGAVSVTDWEDVYPFNKIRPCLLDEQGKVVTYLNKNDYTKDTFGNTVTMNDSYNVMIEIPQFYYSTTINSNTLQVIMSNEKKDSNYVNDAFMNGNTNKGKFYVGAYLASSIGNKLKSQSGKLPETSLNLTNARTRAMNNGSGYSLLGYNQLLALQLLYILRFKNLDSQSVLGLGLTRYLESNPSYTGVTDKIGLNSTPVDTENRCKLLGIEDFYGNALCWIDGAKLDYVSDGVYSFKTSNTPANFNDNGNSYVQVTTVNRTANSNGFIKKVSGVNGATLLPSEIDYNGNHNQYFCDYSALSGNFINFGAGVQNGLVNDPDYLTGVFSISFGRNETYRQNNASRIMYL